MTKQTCAMCNHYKILDSSVGRCKQNGPHVNARYSCLYWAPLVDFRGRKMPNGEKQKFEEAVT